MIKHVVQFQLKDFNTPEEKQAKLDEIKTALLALPEKIEVLKDIKVFFNCNPIEKFDFMLDTTFDSLEDLSTYNTHPAHLDVVNIIKPAAAARACVDYEI